MVRRFLSGMYSSAQAPFVMEREGQNIVELPVQHPDKHVENPGSRRIVRVSRNQFAYCIKHGDLRIGLSQKERAIFSEY